MLELSLEKIYILKLELIFKFLVATLNFDKLFVFYASIYAYILNLKSFEIIVIV